LHGTNGVQISGTYPEYTIGLSGTATSINAFDSTSILMKGAKNILTTPAPCDESINVSGSRMLWYSNRGAFRAGWTADADDEINNVSHKV